MAIGLEAKCRKCRETFNPLADGDLELIHFERIDGTVCGGLGDVTGEWGRPCEPQAS